MAKPIISRSRSASGTFSTSLRRFIVSLVIGGSSNRAGVSNPTLPDESSMTTAKPLGGYGVMWGHASRAASLYRATPQGTRPVCVCDARARGKCMISGAWRSEEVYPNAKRVEAADIAWEWLRRDHEYQRAYQALVSDQRSRGTTDDFRQQWGLSFR